MKQGSLLFLGLLACLLVVANVSAATLSVGIKNVEGMPLPGNNGGTLQVVLYDSNWKWIAEKNVVYNGGETSRSTSFFSIDDGSYKMEVYNKPDIAGCSREFWGGGDLNVGGSSCTYSFVRHTQFFYGAKVNSNTWYLGTPKTVESNTPVLVAITVKNLEPTDHLTRVRAYFDRNKASSWDYNSGYIEKWVTKYGTNTFSFTFTPTTPGVYYFRYEIEGDYGDPVKPSYTLTDQSEWFDGVIVQEPLTLPSVSTSSAAPETTSATLSGSLDSLGGDTQCTLAFKYKPSSSSSWITVSTGSRTTSGTFSATITGLNPGTKYDYQAVATNSAGSNSGSIKTFTTETPAPAITLPAVSTVSATPQTTSATLSGSLDSLGSAASCTLTFQYKPSSSSSWITISSGSRTTPGTFPATITGLNPGTKYDYQAVATNSAGSVSGSIKTFTTETPAPVITLPAVSTVSATPQTGSATLSGSLDSLGGAASCTLAFKYKPSSSSSWITVSAGSRTTSGTFSATITGLNPGTKYDYQAAATNSAGSTSGSIKTLTTETPAPTITLPAVSTVSATPQTTSATLSGSLDSLGGAASCTLTFKYKPSSSSSWITVSAGSRTTAGSFPVTITSLSPGTKYDYQAVATNTAGSVSGSIKTFTTETPALAITLPSVSTVSATPQTGSATLSGSLDSLGSAASCTLAFKYKPSSSSSWITVSSGSRTTLGTFSATITGLNPGTKYDYQAVATNTAGSVSGSIKTFTTETSAPTITLKPDLIVVGFSASPEKPKAEETIRFTVNYKNQGDQSTEGVWRNDLNQFVSVFLIDLYVDGTRIGQKAVPNLEVGESGTVDFTWTVPRSIASGAHEVRVLLDTIQPSYTSEKAVTESNEANNERKISLEIIKINPYGTLTINVKDGRNYSSVERASITIDGKLAGYSAANGQFVHDVTEGEVHSVEVKHTDYYQKVEKTTLEYNKPKTVTIYLQYANVPLKVTVRDSDKLPISNAEVFINNVCLGKTDVHGILQCEAREKTNAQIKVTARGYYQHDGTAYIGDRSQDLAVGLRREDPKAPNIEIEKIVEVGDGDGIIEEGEQAKITFSVKDDSGVKSVTVYFDGQVIDTYNDAGTYTTTIGPLTIGSHSLTFEAVDADPNPHTTQKQVPITVSSKGPSVGFTSTSKTISTGENAVFEMSALNPVGGKEMQVQLIVKPPPGISISSTHFARSGGGLYEAKYTLSPGSDAKGMSLEVIGNEEGTYLIDAEIYYAFPGGESHFLKQTLQLEVQSPESKRSVNAGLAGVIPSTPGFGVLATLIALFVGIALCITKKG